VIKWRGGVTRDEEEKKGWWAAFDAVLDVMRENLLRKIEELQLEIDKHGRVGMLKTGRLIVISTGVLMDRYSACALVEIE
jgi:hypothetical protein